MSTIVVAYSPDEYGQVALARAVEEARLRDAGLLVVNGTRGDALVDEHFAHADQLAEIEQALATTGLPFEVRQTFGADVGDQVIEAAASSGAELIVIGVRRRTPVGKLLMGSVSQRVILGAECAVLAVKPD
ncbi:universal stress protein [Nocardioides dubius]|uniref:Universal stress protein n=1 Tax=Nocardioides dubius TaxID=317019 RepID=A0ABP4EQ57_9ACTN